MLVCGLFESYYADNECNRVDSGCRDMDWVVVFVVGNEVKITLLCWFDALDEWTLVGVYYIRPLVVGPAEPIT